MKLKQLEYVLVVARTRSFSKAAKELYVSQPNISAAINSLEKDIGFKIFKRTNLGIELTSKGVLFIHHAKNIVSEIEKIPFILKEESYRKISIGLMFNHTLVSKAFIKFCSKYEDDKNINFSIYTDSSKDIIEKIYMNKRDLGIVLMDPIVLEGYIRAFGNKNLDFKIMKNMIVNVNLKKDHPLIENGELDFEKLNKYPFVNYNFNNVSHYDIINDFPEIVSRGYINFDKMINIDEKETRRQIILSTNAFSIGASFHPDMERIDEIVSIPIENIKMILALIIRKDTENREEIKVFTDFFLKELEKIKQ